MPTSNILVIYYSRSGTTRKVAKAMASALGCDIEEITDMRDRRGGIGYLRSLFEAVWQRPSVIAPIAKDPSGYQLVIIGTPVWFHSTNPTFEYWRTHRFFSLPRSSHSPMTPMAPTAGAWPNRRYSGG